MPPAYAAFWLLAAHFINDYPLQGDTVALQKNRHVKNPLSEAVPWPYWMTAHALQHGAAVLLILGRLDLAITETVSHWVIDYMKCEKYISIHMDQGLHILCKVVWLTVWFLLQS